MYISIYEIKYIFNIYVANNESHLATTIDPSKYRNGE